MLISVAPRFRGMRPWLYRARPACLPAPHAGSRGIRTPARARDNDTGPREGLGPGLRRRDPSTEYPLELERDRDRDVVPPRPGGDLHPERQPARREAERDLGDRHPCQVEHRRRRQQPRASHGRAVPRNGPRIGGMQQHPVADRVPELGGEALARGDQPRRCENSVPGWQQLGREREPRRDACAGCSGVAASASVGAAAPASCSSPTSSAPRRPGASPGTASPPGATSASATRTIDAPAAASAPTARSRASRSARLIGSSEASSTVTTRSPSSDTAAGSPSVTASRQRRPGRRGRP